MVAQTYITTNDQSDAMLTAIASDIQATLALVPDSRVFLSLFEKLTQGDVSLLIYCDIDDKGQPVSSEIVVAHRKTGAEIDLATLPAKELKRSQYPVLHSAYGAGIQVVGDLQDDRRWVGATEEERSFFSALEIRAALLVPLKMASHFQGLLCFGWSSPQQFNQQIVSALADLSKPAGPVAAALRGQYVTERTNRRAETLSLINAMLLRAQDEDEILAAISLHTDAESLFQLPTLSLDYLEVDEISRAPITSRGVALWKDGGPDPDFKRLSQLMALEQNSFSKLWVDYSDSIVLIDDVLNSDMDNAAKAKATQLNCRSLVFMPLYGSGNWQGLLTVRWPGVHPFTDDDRVIFAEIQRTAASVVTSRRGHLAEEYARQRAETIAAINASLSQATHETQILDGIAPYTGMFSLSLLSLAYFVEDERNRPVGVHTVAFHNTEGFTGAPATEVRIDKSPILQHTYEHPDEILLIEDLKTDTRFTTQGDDMLAPGLSSAIFVPLEIGGQRQGILSLGWDKPQIVDESLLEILSATQPTLSAVVSTRRLLQLTQRLYKATEERLRAVIGNAPISLFALDPDGTIALMEGNGLAGYGVRPGELVGQSVFDAFKLFPSLLDQSRRALSGESFSTTLELNNLTYQSWYSPVINEAGAVTGVINVSMDITERRAAENERERLIRQLRVASQFKDEFFAVMSHELRTPLNAMIGLLGISLMEGNLGADDHELISRARANSERLLQLINNILDISRMEAGRLEIVPHQVLLSELVRKLTANMSVLAEQKNLLFDVDVDTSLPETVFMDGDALTKIFTNLVSNAIKFTHIGSVSVKLFQHEENLIIQVTDTGIGIPAHMQDVIFDSFRQVDASSTRAYGGSGLGLAIVRNLCTAMKGTIRLDSKQNVGSTFSVSLPLGMVPVQ